MKKYSYSTFLLFGILSLISFISSANAEIEANNIPINALSPMPVKAESKIEIKQSMPENDSEVTILRDDYMNKYNKPTLANLAKTYWRLGAFDTLDDVAVSNFLKINDCEIYTDYVNDDLEWKKIVQSMREHLDKNKAIYPLNYQFMLELHLGKYDVAKDGFPIVDKTGFTDSKRILVESSDKNREICHDERPILDHPRGVIVILTEPITLDFLKIDEHVAQAYILRKKSEISQMSEEQQANQYERDAHLRLRITFSQYHGNIRGDGAENLAILHGNIDGYEVFEDKGQSRLMLSVDKTK